MDAFELLKKDHKKVAQLFKEIEAASGQTKKQLFARLKGELEVHAQVEERIFYPALENKEEARDITLEAYEEHKVVKDLLGELASNSAPEDEWDAKLKVLRENVEHHVEEEEGELFSKARQALSKKAIEQIGADMEAAKGNQQSAAPQASSRSGSEVENKTGNASTKISEESPGVLRRLANLVGLGDSATSSTSARSKGAPKRRSGAKATKLAGKKSVTKTNAAKRTGEAGSSKSSKKTAKKSGGRSTKPSGSKRAGKKSATRSRGDKKAQGRTAKKRSR